MARVALNDWLKEGRKEGVNYRFRLTLWHECRLRIDETLLTVDSFTFADLVLCSIQAAVTRFGRGFDEAFTASQQTLRLLLALLISRIPKKRPWAL